MRQGEAGAARKNGPDRVAQIRRALEPRSSLREGDRARRPIPAGMGAQTVRGVRRRDTAVVVVAAVLYLVFSFFQWQHFTVTIVRTVRYGFNEWHGIGVIACVLAIAVILWELARLFGLQLQSASVSAAFVSLALAVLLLLFTVLTFLSRSDGRQWPAWVGLALSFVIALAAFARARAEGVELFRLTPARSDDDPKTR